MGAAKRFIALSTPLTAHALFRSRLQEQNNCSGRALCCDTGIAPKLSAQRLTNKVCIVTGGSSGIGRAVCERLAREGARLVVLDVRRAPREGGAEVLDIIAAARRDEGLPIVHDIFVQGSVADAHAASTAVSQAVACFGRVDVLVNNAALLAGSPLLETTEEEWDAVMSVNAKGTFLCTKAAIAQFMQQEQQGSDGIRGRVVNISSQHGMVYCPGSLAYGVSKATVAYMTRQIGAEYIKHGIIVNAVAPGRIITGRPGSRLDGEDFSEEEAQENRLSFARTPHGAIRLGQPRDVAAAVAFLASDDATYIVGENVMVDGGYKAS